MVTKNFFVHDGLKVRGDTLLNGDTYNDTALSKLHVKTDNNGAGANLNNVNGLIIENGETSNTSYALKLATGTGNVFSVTNAGNLGIGTTAPSAPLDVAGSICADSDSWFNGVRVGLGNGNCGNNTVVGDRALYSNTTGNDNTAIGNTSLYSNTTGNFNTGTGQGSLACNTTGLANTAIGYNSLKCNTTGIYNTASGFLSLGDNTTGTSNTATGFRSLCTNTTGNWNTASGMYSLQNNTTGCQNTAHGYNALFGNTTGSKNAAVGYESLKNNTTSSNNTSHGYQSLYTNTTGTSNTASGICSLYNNTTGFNNVANGASSLFCNTTGCNNTSLGVNSLNKNTTGYHNTASGYGAVRSNTTGFRNTGTGYASLFYNTTGCFNTATGGYSLFKNTTGTYNAGYGYESIRNITTGNCNIALGYFSGCNITTGSNNITIGLVTCTSTNGDSDSIVIGNNLTGLGSNTINIGNSSNTKTVFEYGNVGIGTTDPNEKLTVSGNISASGTIYADAFNSNTGGTTIDFNDDVDLNGNLTFSSSSDILIPDNAGAALEIKEGSNVYQRFITTNGGEVIELYKYTTASAGFKTNSLSATSLSGSAGAGVTTGATIALGGDLGGSVALDTLGGTKTLTATIQANSVALATDTTGNYVQSLSLNTTTPSLTGSSLAAAEGNTITGLGLSATGVTANSYGSTTVIPVITVLEDGRISNVSTSSIPTDLTIAADSGSNDTVTIGTDTLTFAGTSNEVDTTVSNNQIQIGLPNTVSVATSLSTPLILAGDGSVSAPSYSFTGDTNTGMWRPGSDQLRFNTGGADRLCLTSSLATFTNSVCVNDNITIAGNLIVHGACTTLNTTVTATSAFRVDNDGTGPALVANQTGSQPIADFQDDGTSVFYIEDGGNVGLGTTNPEAGLHIYGSGQQALFVGSSNGARALLELDGASNGDGAGGDYAYLAHNADGSFDIKNLQNNSTNFASGSAGTTKMTITSGGNVGIGGVTTPESPLQVCGSVNSFQAHFGRQTNGTSCWAGISLGYAENANNLYRKVGIAAKTTGDNHARQELHFLVDSAGDANSATITDSKMMITSAGDVGIGTTSPTARLQVKDSVDNSYESGLSVVRSADNATTWINLKGGSTNFNNKNHAEDAGLSYNWLQNGSEKMRIHSDGNVGIGTTAPSQKLEVVGAAVFGGSATKLTTYSDSTYSGIFNGSTLSSDESIYFGSGHTYFVNDGSASVVIEPNGNFGIGTSAASYKLHVVGPGHVTSTLSVGSGGDTGGLSVSPTGGTNAYGLSLNRSSLSRNSPDIWDNIGDAIVIGAESSDTTLAIVSGGNVGIGTTSPGYKLEVSADTNSTVNLLRLRNADATYSQTWDFQSDTNKDLVITGNSATGGIKMLPGSRGLVLQDTGGDVKFTLDRTDARTYSLYTESNGSLSIKDEDASTDRISILSGGDVGIGTTSPGTKLDVAGIISVRENSNVAFYGGNFIRLFVDSNFQIKEVGGASRLNLNTTTGDLSLYNSSTVLTNHIDTDGNSYFNGGNVGIGTTNPSQKLHVRGEQAYLYNDINTNNTYFYARNSSSGNAGIKMKNSQGEWTIIANDRLRFYDNDNSVERLTILSSGNVGIGTTSPGNKLSIVGSTTTTNLAVTGGGSFSGNDFGTVFKTTATATKRTQIFFKDSTDTITSRVGNDIEGANSAKLQFVAGSGSTPHMSILSGGNVGIGTTAPDARLEVLSDGSVSGGAEIRLTHANNNTNDVVSTLNFANSVGSVAMIQGGTTGANNTGYISFFTDNAGTSSEKVRIIGDGNVGLGTTSPIGKLHIYKSDGSLNYLEANPSTEDSSLGNIYGRWNGSNAGLISFRSGSDTTNKDNGDIAFYTSTAGGSLVRAMTIDENQKVGIGTASPTSLLHIDTGANSAANFKLGSNRTSANAAVGQVVGDWNGTVVAKIALKTGDDTTNKDNGEIAFEVAAAGSTAEAMRINKDGYVGIGIQPSNQRLEISGNFLLQNNNEIRQKDTGGTQRTIIELDGSNDLNIGGSYAGALKFIGGGSYSEVMRIHDDGNVGIGTASPSKRLEVVDSAAAQILAKGWGPDSAGNDGGAIQLGEEAAFHGLLSYDNGTSILYIDNAYNSSSGDIRFRTKTSGTAITALTIEGSGNVGIGTTGPDYNLHVKGSTSATLGLEGTGGSKDTWEITSSDLGGKAVLNFRNDDVSSTILTLHQDGCVIPGTDNTIDLGSSSKRWANVYANCTTTGAVIESNLCTNGLDSCPEGSVVIWREGKLQGTTDAYSHRVMGVTAPGSESPIVMGAENILVTGDIEEGDTIVTSDKYNHGMKGSRSEDLHGKVIAEALESGSGESYIIKGMIRKF